MSTPQWTADIAIDATIAAHAIASQFPALGRRSVEPFGAGWDNAAYLVDERWVFRFPRRRVAVKLIERECALLPRMASALPLTIPAPVYIGARSKVHPAPFAGYAYVAGRTASSLRPDAIVRHGDLAVALGAFLRALHAIDTAELTALGLPEDEIGRLDHRKRLTLARERAPSLAGIGLDPVPWLTWLAEHPPRALDARRRAVVHGDLYARHVLLDDDGMPSGIIDWGDIHHGDPALDLAIAHHLLPAHAHAAFRDAYGDRDAATWEAARYRAVYHAILEIDYGVREDDAEMIAIGRETLARISGALDS